MEVWDLFDENGNKTGKTMKRGEPIPVGYYHLGADIWIMNSENKILIQKRSGKKTRYPNTWAMTGGSAIKGENSIQAIDRETKEELGIKLNLDSLKLIKRYKTTTAWIDTYFIKQDINLCDIVMQDEEVSDVRWATYSEIEELCKNNQFIESKWNRVKSIIKQQ